MRQINDDKTVYTREETQMEGKYKTLEPVFRGGYMTASMLKEAERRRKKNELNITKVK